MNSFVFAVRNRHNLKLTGTVENANGRAGLVFLIHGLASSIGQKYIRYIRKSLLDNDYRVVSIDATNAYGDSDGTTMNASITSYLHDIEDVIKWASTQSWYAEKFIVAGHSLGGAAMLAYTKAHSHRVKAVMAFAPVISYQTWLGEQDEARIQQWQHAGHYIHVSKAQKGKVSKVGWSLVEDAKKYDFIRDASSFTQPLLLVCGTDEHAGTSSAILTQFHKATKDTSDLHIIEGMQHNARNPKHLDQVHVIISDWLSQL